MTKLSQMLLERENILTEIEELYDEYDNYIVPSATKETEIKFKLGVDILLPNNVFDIEVTKYTISIRRLCAQFGWLNLVIFTKSDGIISWEIKEFTSKQTNASALISKLLTTDDLILLADECFGYLVSLNTAQEKGSSRRWDKIVEAEEDERFLADAIKFELLDTLREGMVLNTPMSIDLKNGSHSFTSIKMGTSKSGKSITQLTLDGVAHKTRYKIDKLVDLVYTHIK